MTPDAAQQALLRRALGLSSAPGADPARNEIRPDLDSKLAAACDVLCAAGLMELGFTDAGVLFYRATPPGIRAVWGRAAVYLPTGDEVTARLAQTKVHVYWQGASKGRFRTGEVYRVSPATVRWL